jgi:hypothetical protein
VPEKAKDLYVAATSAPGVAHFCSHFHCSSSPTRSFASHVRSYCLQVFQSNFYTTDTSLVKILHDFNVFVYFSVATMTSTGKLPSFGSFSPLFL